MKPSRFEPYSLLVIALCFAWTSQNLFFGRGLEEAGAATRHLLWEGDWWRAVTTILLHAGWIHLIVNGLAIWFVGPVLVHGVGGPVFLATLLFSAFAGLAASLWTHEPIMRLVGISGGVLGMIGLILALEWRHARGWMDFFRARNTRVIIVLLLVNAGIAVYFETGATDVNLDHAAHIGGLLFGLVGGLALFGRERVHLGRGLLAALLLAVLPLAAAAYPNWSEEHIPHLRASAEEAGRAGDEPRQRQLLQRILDLDPHHPIACSVLALLDDDPALLARAREPVGDHEKHPFVVASLELATRRLSSAPEQARAIAERAVEFPIRDFGKPWLAFALAADEADQAGLAALAYAHAAKQLPTALAWKAAYHALSWYGQRLSEPGGPDATRAQLALEAAEMALRAAGGLAEDGIEDGSERTAYEAALGAFARRLSSEALRLERLDPQPDAVPELARRLYKLWERIGANAEGSRREAEYYFNSAVWWWIATGGAEAEAIAARARAARDLAPDDSLRRRIEAWARTKRLKLAPPGDGG